RLRSSWRIPTVISRKNLLWPSPILGALPYGSRMDIDRPLPVSHSFFRGSKKRASCPGQKPNSLRHPAHREDIMKKFATAMLAGVAMSMTLATIAQAKDKVIGVSWSNFQEERWKTDEAAMKAAIEAAGDKYISADAQSSPAKQLTDVESLISQGANAL